MPTSLVITLANGIPDRYRALVLLMGFVNTRTGELLGLRRCDVDLAAREVYVRRQAQELTGSGRTELDYTKTDAGRRPLSIPTLVADALEHHMQRYTAATPQSPIFTGPQGGPLRRATLSRAWQDAKRAAHAPDDLRLYDLRHHAATVPARMPGITTKELMAQIGHSSWAAAIRYQHAAAERNHAIAAFLEEQIASATSTARDTEADQAAGSQGAGEGLATETEDDEPDPQ